MGERVSSSRSGAAVWTGRPGIGLLMAAGWAWLALSACTTPTSGGGGGGDNTNNGAVDTCVSECGDDCPGLEPQECGTDGHRYCSVCARDCNGARRAEPWRCEPSGTGETALGHGCEATEACAAGLSCMTVHTGPECAPQTMACGALCEVDGDCAAFGANAGCFEDCTGARSCGVRATDDLPLGATCQTTDQCEAGLACMPFSGGDPCMEFGRVCTIACDTDADCLALTDNALCFQQCDGSLSCGLTR